MRLFRERVLPALPARVEALRRALAPAGDLPHVGEVRHRGLMVGIELVRDRATKAEYAYGTRSGHRVCLEARRLGAILRPLGNVVVLMPPPAMEEPQLAELAGIALEAIATVTPGLEA
jgi:adenosylmethionine-8-amino-7-oxononanoate aminotransferase